MRPRRVDGVGEVARPWRHMSMVDRPGVQHGPLLTMTAIDVPPMLRVMNTAKLPLEDRRRFAAHLASEIFAPDARLTIPLSPTETNALADLLDILAARTVEDPLGTEQILNTAAHRMSARLRERLADSEKQHPA